MRKIALVVVSVIGGVRSYTAGNAAGETIDVAAKGVDNAYGAQGKDTLIGNAANNWLAGGHADYRRAA